MVAALREQCVLSEHDIDRATERARKALREYWTDRIALTWSVDDVQTVLEELGITKTDASCREILQRVLRRADADVGVSWDTIRTTILDAKELP